MIFILPYLQAIAIDEMIDIEPSIQRLHDWAAEGASSNVDIEFIINAFINRHDKGDAVDKDLIFLQINNVVYLERETVFADLRVNEYEEFSVSGAQSVAQFNVKRIRRDDAWRSIGSTSFLIFMLGALAMAFTKDTEEYVVKPIRDMTNAIRNLATYEKAMNLMVKIKDRKSVTFDR